MQSSLKSLVRSALVITLAAVSIFAVFRLTSAGSLSPSASVAGTMNTASDIYDALTGTSYDSSGITGSLNGSALQVSKCIISRIQGSPCP